jgi:DNA-binding CsgD family transcriptional regulator
MAHEVLQIDVMVDQALCRVEGSSPAWSSGEAKLVASARSTLQRLTSSSPVFSVFDAIRGLLPFAAGMIDVMPTSHPTEPTHLVYDVPEAFLRNRARLIHEDPAIPLASMIPVARALTGTDVMPEGLFERVPYNQEMYTQFGLDNVTGMILSSAAGGAARESSVLWLFSGSGVRLPTREECRRLELVSADICDALERSRLPLVPHQRILFQVMQEQELGYIVLRSDGTILEANRRAVMLAQKYAIRGSGSWRRRIDELASAARIRGARGLPARQRLRCLDGPGVLDLHAHRLAKESHAISEDIILIQLEETGKDRPAVEGALHALTPRQREVATLLVKSGLSHKQIAEKLGRSTRTVEKHVEKIFRALGVRSRPELVARVLE